MKKDYVVIKNRLSKNNGTMSPELCKLIAGNLPNPYQLVTRLATTSEVCSHASARAHTHVRLTAIDIINCLQSNSSTWRRSDTLDVGQVSYDEQTNDIFVKRLWETNRKCKGHYKFRMLPRAYKYCWQLVHVTVHWFTQTQYFLQYYPDT